MQFRLLCRSKLLLLLMLALLASLSLGTCNTSTAIKRGSAPPVTAHLSKTSFYSSEAGSVKLTCKFSRPSSAFSYVLDFRSGAKWKTIKNVSKKGIFMGSKTMTMKTLFAGRKMKTGSYRLRLSSSDGSRVLNFRVIPIKRVPVNIDPPEITGTFMEGYTLGVTVGEWKYSPTSYEYQWYSCEWKKETSAATNCVVAGSDEFYALKYGDAGGVMKVEVTAKNNEGKGTATSPPTPIIEVSPW